MSQNAKCLVFISSFSEEIFNRINLHAADYGDKLVNTVASHCANTIVIVNSVSQLNLEALIDHSNVTAVIWSGITNVLFGDFNPGGKLVFTLAKNDSDYGTYINITLESNYTEGIFLDYRHFDKYNIVPRYYFGASLQYQQRRMKSYTKISSSTLYEPIYEITFTVINTGKVYGSEVPQLYLEFPAEAEEPPKVLRGFDSVHLQAGESKQITFILTQKDISYWNVVNQKWTIASGNYTAL